MHWGKLWVWVMVVSLSCGSWAWAGNGLAELERLNAKVVELYGQGKRRKATSFAEKALDICREIHGEQHRDTATCLNNLGELLRAQGDFAAARPHLEEALKIRKKILGDQDLDTAQSLHNLGGLLLEQGKYAAARPHLQQAVLICKAVLGEEHAHTAACLNSLALLLQRQGDYAAAQPHLEQVVKICKNVYGENHLHTAASHNNFGLLLVLQGEYATAEPHYEQALKTRSEILGEEHADTAQSYNNLGALLYVQGRLTAARPHYEKALKIRREVLGKEHPDTAESLNNLGVLLHSQGDYVAARPHLEQAVMICKDIFGEEHPDTTAYLGNLATLEAAVGNWEAAAQRFGKSRRGIRRHVSRVLVAQSEQEQLKFLNRNDRGSWHRALSLGLARATDQELADLSAEWLLNGKAIAHEALASRTLLARDNTDPELADTVKELLEVRRQLAALSLRAPPPEEESRRKTKLQELGEREATLARRLAPSQPVVGESWVELDELRNRLSADDVLIDVARFNVFDFQATGDSKKWEPARYVAWLIPAAGAGDVKIIDLGAAEAIDAAIALAREKLITAAARGGVLREQGEAFAEEQFRRDLKSVADLVWKPLAQNVAEARRLLLSPDGALWLLPWNALPVSNGKFLVEEYLVTHLVSGRDMLSTGAPQRPMNRPVLFANPDFDLSADEVRRALEAVFRNRPWPKANSPRTRTALPRVSPLPGTAAEVQAISPNVQRFAKQTPAVCTGKFALESIFKKVRQPRLAVLSTHGFFLPDQEIPDHDLLASSQSRDAALSTVDGKPVENPLLRCGLLLAGCNQAQPADADDGVLTGMEIVGLDLRGTELVVLSACETGVGKVRSGEGVAGLRQAFQLAGAEGVVATLWQIPDVQSARLMNDFFIDFAAGQSKGQALRNAQLRTIEDRRDKFGGAHPFFWAAFTLTGQAK